MAKCSIRSCNDTAVAGFAEIFEVNSPTFPRRTIPGATRYWCRRHNCLALEVQGKLGRPIDLTVTASEDAPSLNNEAAAPVSENIALKQEVAEVIQATSVPTQPATADRRRQERFRVDGPAEVIAGNAGILFRGETHDLSQTGCHIRSKCYLSASAGEEVEVRFSVSDVHFRALARVKLVRRGKGASFEFLRVEENIQRDFNTLIERLGCPTPLPSAMPPEFLHEEH